MDIMKPIYSQDIPDGDEWLYEMKYDGFRCVLHWEQHAIKLISKNNKDLTENFPEIIAYCHQKQSLVATFLPLTLDGELVVLNHPYQANFTSVQKRGRLKSKDSIQKASEARPASLLVFDLLQLEGENLRRYRLQQRKKLLHTLCTTVTFHSTIRSVPSYEHPENLWQLIDEYKGEGMIAKRKTSVYTVGKRHSDWFKIKNWRTIQGFLTHMNAENGYFTIGVYEQGTIKTIGKCKHGLGEEAKGTLTALFMTKGDKKGNDYTLPPAICVAVYTLDLYKDELREPMFKQLLPTITPETCTMEQMKLDMAMIPEVMTITNTDKVYWPEKRITKGDFLAFIRDVSPYMLPFLKEKALTIIRFPDGVQGEHFFQKHLPSYAPTYIDTVEVDNNKRIVVNQLEGLLWLANQGALEYHVPFHTIDSIYPNEIVFDLDPPAKDEFDLAVQAALILKPLLDELKLTSFVKTSGQTGMQIHIPIQPGSMTYEETALFTQGIAWTLENAYPDLFTTERLKKNRQERLYIDYVQHGKDKTLIVPYSPRKTTTGTIATPLYWHEVEKGLNPEQFTLEHAIKRIQEMGCPFAGYFEAGETQKLDKMLKMIEG